MKILISGGTGLVGKKLIEKLNKNGHETNILVRNKSRHNNEFSWDYKNKKIDEKAFENIDCIIHLAGASISKRWTEEYKKEIISSRVESAHFLLETSKNLNINLKSFISASGTNFYGTFTSDRILTEKDEIQHQDFLAHVCKVWEAAAQNFSEITERIVCIRTAPVLSKKGGTLEPLTKITNLNLSSGIGSGRQWFNWIHIDDLADIYLKAVEDENLHGAYNAVSDNIPTQKELMQKLAKTKKKFFFPLNIPSFLMKIVLGEMSEIILKGTRISNEKIKSQGFIFQYPDLESALKDLV